MLAIQLVFSCWPALLGGITSLLVPTLRLQRGAFGPLKPEVYPMEEVSDLQNEREVTQVGT